MGADNEEERPIGYSPFFEFVKDIFVKPCVWVRKNIVEPNQQTYYWYHRKYQRVPTVDQCYDDDMLCKWEATMQMKRDKSVEAAIVQLLRDRLDDCLFYEGYDRHRICLPYSTQWEDAATNWFIKYGDLSYGISAEDVYFKQKHRLIWERRHGQVGTGEKDKDGNRIPLEKLVLPPDEPWK